MSALTLEERMDMPLGDLMQLPPFRTPCKPRPQPKRYTVRQSPVRRPGLELTSDQILRGADMTITIERSSKRGRNDSHGGVHEYTFGDQPTANSAKRQRAAKADQDPTKWHQVFGTFTCSQCNKTLLQSNCFLLLPLLNDM